MNAGSSRIYQWSMDPESFVENVFGVKPDAWQRKVLAALPLNQRISMQACKGPGKTAVLAWSMWWFMITRWKPKMACCSITDDNLRDCLWAELSKWAAMSTFIDQGFVVGKKRIENRRYPKEWFCSARTWSKSANAEQQNETLAGLHADDMMFVLDEVGGIPNAVMSAAKYGLSSDLTGDRCKILMAGNPSRRDGPLWRAANEEAHLWYRVEISADPDDPDRTPRVNIDLAREEIALADLGREDPWVMTNILGKFPPNNIDSLIGREEVIAAMKRNIQEPDFERSQKRIGVDVARFGDDSTIIAPRQGLWSGEMIRMRGADSIQVADRVLYGRFVWGSEIEFIDGTGGYGSGVIDRMKLLGGNPVDVKFNERASSDRYYNRRTEMWIRMRDWIRAGASMDYDEELAAELSAATYTYHGDKMRLEPKESIKKRLGRSPDKADALALTFAMPEMRAALTDSRTAKAGRTLHEYDVLSD